MAPTDDGFTVPSPVHMLIDRSAVSVVAGAVQVQGRLRV